MQWSQAAAGERMFTCSPRLCSPTLETPTSSLYSCGFDIETGNEQETVLTMSSPLLFKGEMRLNIVITSLIGKTNAISFGSVDTILNCHFISSSVWLTWFDPKSLHHLETTCVQTHIQGVLFFSQTTVSLSTRAWSFTRARSLVSVSLMTGWSNIQDVIVTIIVKLIF